MPYVSADFTNVLGSFYAGMQIKMAHEKHTRDMEKEDAETAFKSIGEWQNLYNAEVFDWAESQGMDMESFDYSKLSPSERAQYNAYINEKYPGAAKNVKDLYNKYVTPTMKGSTKGPLEFIQSLISPDEFHLIGKTKDGEIVPKTKNGTAEPDDPVLSLGINEIANRTRASLATRYGFNALTAQQVLEYASGDPVAAKGTPTASDRVAAADASTGQTVGESSVPSSGEGSSDGASATNQDPAKAALAGTPSAETEFAQRFEGVEEERLARALASNVVGTGPQEGGYTASNEGLLPPEQRLYDTYSRNGENGPLIGQQFADTGQNPFSMAEQRKVAPEALAGTTNPATYERNPQLPSGNIDYPGSIAPSYGFEAGVEDSPQPMPPSTYNDQLGTIPDNGIQSTQVPISGAVRTQESLDETYVAESGEYIPENNEQKWDRQIADVNTRLIQAKKDTKDAIADLNNIRDPRERKRQEERIAAYQEKEKNLETEYALAQQAKEEGLTNQQAAYRAQNQARSTVENQRRAQKAEENRLIAKAKADKTATTTQNDNGTSTKTSGESTQENANGSVTTIPAGTFETTTSDDGTSKTTQANVDKLGSVVASAMAKGTPADVDKVLSEAVMELGPTGTTKAINDVLQQAAGGIPLDGTRSSLTGTFVAVRNPAKRRMVAGLMMEMGFFGERGAEATSTAMTYMQTGMMPDQIKQHWEMYTKAAEANQSIWAAKASRSEALTAAGKGIADAMYKQSMIELKQTENNIKRAKALAEMANNDLQRRKLLLEIEGAEIKNANQLRLLNNATEADQVEAEKLLESAMLNTTTPILRQIRGIPGVEMSDEFTRDSINASISSIIANEKDVLVATGLQFMAQYGTAADKALAAEAQQLMKVAGQELPADIKAKIIRNTEKYNNYAAAALVPAAVMGEYVRNDSPRENFSVLDIFTYGENMGDMGTGRVADLMRKIPFTPFFNDDAQLMYSNIKSQVEGGAGLQSQMQYQYGLILQEQLKKRDKAYGLNTAPYMQ